MFTHLNVGLLVRGFISGFSIKASTEKGDMLSGGSIIIMNLLSLISSLNGFRRDDIVPVLRG